jgi:hypothetical protein
MPARSEPSQPGVEMTISPLGHALFLGLIVLPFAVAPYIAITNRLKAMDGAIQGVSAALTATRGELRAAVRESAVRREEHRLLEKAGHALRSDFGHLRAQLHKARLDLKALETRQRTAAAAGTQQLRCALPHPLNRSRSDEYAVSNRRHWVRSEIPSEMLRPSCMRSSYVGGGSTTRRRATEGPRISAESACSSRHSNKLSPRYVAAFLLTAVLTSVVAQAENRASNGSNTHTGRDSATVLIVPLVYSYCIICGITVDVS